MIYQLRYVVHKKSQIIIEKHLAEINFTISKKYEGVRVVLYIDEVKRKWVVKKRGFVNGTNVYSFSDLLGFELYENGVLFPSKSKKCRNIELELQVDNPCEKRITIPLLDITAENAYEKVFGGFDSLVS